MSESFNMNMLNKENFCLLRKRSKWLFSYVKKHLGLIILYTLIGMTGTLVALLASFASRDMVDIVTGRMTGELLKTFVLLIGTQIVTIIINQSSIYCSAYISQKIDVSLKNEVYDKIMQSDWEAMDEFNSGYFSTRWGGDTSVISNGILSVIPNFIISLFKLVTSLWVVISSDFSFAVIALICVPFTFILSRTNMKRLARVNQDSAKEAGRMNLFINESFSSPHVIKAFDMTDLFSHKIREIQGNVMKNRLRYSGVSGLNSAMTSGLSTLVTYATLGWGIYKVWNNHLTYGNMTLLISQSSNLSAMLQMMVGLIPTAISLLISVGRIMEIEEIPKEDYTRRPEAVKFYEDNKDKGIGIVIKDKMFTYKRGTEVFERLDFEAFPGETIGLVGPSGEGKTTLLRIILSLIHSDEGVANIVAGFDKSGNEGTYIPITASTRVLISYVPQGNTLFAGTIAENMRFIKEDATDEEIIEALKLSCAWDFVSKQKDGINTEIKERGVGLSEGQAQRISIARALIKKAPILLLDEATSALDLETGARVMENIRKDSFKRTCILTTHRPEVAAVCDRIYNINAGDINIVK